MNEQTKSKLHKLADQCKHPDNYHQGPWMDYIQFAELIVRECVSICEINGQSYKHSFTPSKARLAESTSNHCAMMIKQHFGIKE
jgi:hypothetical protein